MNSTACDAAYFADGGYVNTLSIGGVSILATASRLFNLSFAHAPFRANVSNPDIDLKVEWSAQLPSTRSVPLFDAGQTWRAHEFGAGLQFDFYNPTLGTGPFKRMFVQPKFHSALLQLSEEYGKKANYPVEPLGYPLDELLIMHRLTQERAIELHGSGIVRANGVGNLFVGHSGAGKSTTTRLWTSREEVEVLSDDRIIVRPDQPRDGHSDLSAPGPMRMYGTPWHGEAMFASPNSAPLTRIFILEHGHGNVITRLTPSQVVGELFARAFVPFHRHEYVESALSFLEQLADSVPCYRYSFEPDDRAVEKIQHFND